MGSWWYVYLKKQGVYDTIIMMNPFAVQYVYDRKSVYPISSPVSRPSLWYFTMPMWLLIYLAESQKVHFVLLFMTFLRLDP